MRRVREMQSAGFQNRSQSQHSGQSPSQSTRQNENPSESKAESLQTPSKPQETINPLGELFKDKEKLLVLLLIMLLSQDGTNVELVLALLYVII